MNNIDTEKSLSQINSVAQYINTINKSLFACSGRVKGEVTSVHPSGKAVYFKIKDKNENAVLDCLIWLSIYQKNGLNLTIGEEVVVTGTPEIYAANGKFSLIVTTIEYIGEGALKQSYDQLKISLENAGLMANERKRPMPNLPTKIGLITSLSGVVIQDFNSNLNRHGFKIKIINSQVEGKNAIHDLLAAFETMHKQDIEILAIIRGGGSLESLQAFNTESVVRAIAGFKVPVITGIGHDVDVTLSELVADIGKSTPTAVAEALNESWSSQKIALERIQTLLLGRYKSNLYDTSIKLNNCYWKIERSYNKSIMQTRKLFIKLSSNISSISNLLINRIRSANSAPLRSLGVMKTHLNTEDQRLHRMSDNLCQHLQNNIWSIKKSLSDNSKYLINFQLSMLDSSLKSISLLENAIRINNPRRNLKLGYSLSYVNGKLIKNISELAVGQKVVTHLHDSQFTSEIKDV